MVRLNEHVLDRIGEVRFVRCLWTTVARNLKLALSAWTIRYDQKPPIISADHLDRCQAQSSKTAHPFCNASERFTNLLMPHDVICITVCFVYQTLGDIRHWFAWSVKIAPCHFSFAWDGTNFGGPRVACTNQLINCCDKVAQLSSGMLAETPKHQTYLSHDSFQFNILHFEQLTTLSVTFIVSSCLGKLSEYTKNKKNNKKSHQHAKMVREKSH